MQNKKSTTLMKKVQYLNKILLQVLSKPYRANPTLIRQIIENFDTVSFLKIHSLHSMTLVTQKKQIEESQITFLKINYEKHKQKIQDYRKKEIDEENPNKNNEILAYLLKMNYEITTDQQVIDSLKNILQFFE